MFAADDHPSKIVGVDLVFEMLAAGRKAPARPRATAAADLSALPFPDESFGVVWCRLAVGHVLDPAPIYRELSRVLRPGGALLVTDFHPAAVHAGHTRTFRDAAGAKRVVAHVLHEPATHESAAAAAGLAFDARLDLPPVETVKPFYAKAGALDRWETDRALPLLLAFRFLKCESA
jgi:malonyl-CoA O-methyltransferase